MQYRVRLGVMGVVASFLPVDQTEYRRGQRVILRTPRGLEVGQIISAQPASTEYLGKILRRVTPEDELLMDRLTRNRHEAFQDCQQFIQDHALAAALVDVELLFDGQSLIFYFLGDVPTEMANVLAELTETYEAQVQLRKFTESLTEGCGPGCGTEEAAGCSSGGCSVCAIQSACHSKDHSAG